MISLCKTILMPPMELSFYFSTPSRIAFATASLPSLLYNNRTWLTDFIVSSAVFGL